MSPNIVGRVINNRYRVTEFVASGGMGEVYKVWDAQRSAFLAMKVLRADPHEDAAEFRLFQREAEALKTLAHPHIVPFYGIEQAADFSFILEAFVDGPSLKQTLGERRVLPVHEALIYLKALSAALGFAHNQNFVHCDVKPGNVMTDHGGNVFLADFGIVRRTGTTTTTSTTSLAGSGTPAYMAPEQALGLKVTRSTDVYALGVLFYEMITGQRPFSGNEPETMVAGPSLSDRIRYAHIQLIPPDPRVFNQQLPVELSRVLQIALAKQPEQRFASTVDLFEAACHSAGFRSDQVPPRLVTVQPRTVPNPPTRETVIPSAANIPRQIPRETVPQGSQPSQPPPAPIPNLQRKPARAPWLMIAIVAAFICMGGAGLFSIQTLLSTRLVAGENTPVPIALATSAGELTRTRAPEATLPAATLELRSTPTDAPITVSTATAVAALMTEPAAATQPPTQTPQPTQTMPPPPPSATATAGIPETSADRVRILAGTFLMGATDRDTAIETRPNVIGPELPAHLVYLDAYSIDLFEVTNRKFEQFVNATGYTTFAEREGGQTYRAADDTFKPDGNANWRIPDGVNWITNAQANHPVVQISWSDARAYCEWAGGRLPTEAEWEKAARGDDGRLYPWGNDYNGNLLNGSDATLNQDPDLTGYNDGYAFTAPVGSYPSGASPYHVMDMGGNALEWVNDFSSTDYYSHSPSDNPTGPTSGKGHVLRGGSWYSGPKNNRAAHRVFAEKPEIAVQNYGFRCAYDR